MICFFKTKEVNGEMLNVGPRTVSEVSEKLNEYLESIGRVPGEGIFPEYGWDNYSIPPDCNLHCELGPPGKNSEIEMFIMMYYKDGGQDEIMYTTIQVATAEDIDKLYLAAAAIECAFHPVGQKKNEG